MENFINQISQELSQLFKDLNNLPLPGNHKEILLDYLYEIEDEVDYQLEELMRHKNINTFWLSFAPIQHWFGECQEQIAFSSAEPETIHKLNQQLDFWLERIEKSIPNFQPPHQQIVTILELANDGKFYDEETQEYYEEMPEDWPYKHLFEG